MIKNLKKFLSIRDPRDFRGFGKWEETEYGEMIHIDNGQKVLAVAHLDYVMFRPPKISGDKVICPQLDDRLGVWVILDLLPRLGCKFDVLLTDSEEIGQSTAQFFTAAKNRYNWAFSFDRRGTDVVMYHYENHKTCEMVESCGFDVGFGSFSDISYLDLGVCGFNFGVGYYAQHTENCFANLGETFSQALKFVKFFNKYKKERVPYNKPKFQKKSRGLWYDYDSVKINGVEFARERSPIINPQDEPQVKPQVKILPENK